MNFLSASTSRVTLFPFTTKQPNKREHIYIAMYHSRRERTQSYLAPAANGTYDSRIIFIIQFQQLTKKKNTLQSTNQHNRKETYNLGQNKCYLYLAHTCKPNDPKLNHYLNIKLIVGRSNKMENILIWSNQPCFEKTGLRVAQNRV